MGGGTMRTIGRVVGVGYVRGSPVIPLPEQASAARKVSRSSSSSVASNGDSEKVKFVISSRGNTEVPVARKSVCEIDEWEFAEGDLFEPDAPPGRVFFGPPPTREEATEATADLRQTLQKMYFSSPNISGNSAPSTVEASNALEVFATNEAKPTVCVANDHAVINPMMHNNVLQAFSLLNERADVQNMVASLASDQHIWEAVMKNEKVLDFCQSNNACFLPEASAETVPVDECLGSDFAGQNGFWCFVNGMKLKMTEFIGKVSEVALSFTGLEPKKSSKDGKFGNNDFVETAVIQKEDWYKPDVFMYKDLIIALSSRKRMEDAMQVWENMRKDNLFPDSQTYAEVIRGFLKSGSPADAMNIYEDMKKSPEPPNGLPFRILLKGLLPHPLLRNRVKKDFEEMFPDRHVYDPPEEIFGIR